MAWKYAKDIELVKYFEGENIWSKDWESVDKEFVTEPNYGRKIEATVWQTDIKNSTKQFIAVEVSNGC